MKLIVYCAIIISLSACSMSNYISQDVQTPCFTKEKTFRLNAGFPILGFRPSASYSITSALGICGSLTLPTAYPFHEYDILGNFSAEMGIIYYKQMFKKAFEGKKLKLYFDLNSGFGVGSCNNKDSDFYFGESYEDGPEMQINSKWYKGYIQSDLYFSHKKEDSKNGIQFGIGTKLNLCDYQYLNRNDLSYGGYGSDGPLILNVKRSASKFIMPVQDLYCFISNDFSNILNLTFRFGYSIPYSQIQYNDRQIVYINQDYLYNKDDYSEKTGQLLFNQLIINVSIGVKL